MNLLLELLFPKKCVGCKKAGGYFCQDCIGNILQTDLVCPNCDRLAIGGQTHPICKDKFGLNGLWSLGIYENPLKKAIQTLKYKRVKEVSEVLVNIIIEYWAKYQPFVLEQIKKNRGDGWAVVPIPLHWWRENDRGFNQSSQIAKLFSEKLGLKYLDAIKRIKYTKPQVKLQGKQRSQNIKNAFEIDSNYSLSPKPYILLIDDVWTTGSTIRECCYLLKRNGAKKVWGITLAR